MFPVCSPRRLFPGLASRAKSQVSAGEGIWGGWGSNPRPADYEKPGPALRARCLHGYHEVVPLIAPNRTVCAGDSVHEPVHASPWRPPGCQLQNVTAPAASATLCVIQSGFQDWACAGSLEQCLWPGATRCLTPQPRTACSRPASDAASRSSPRASSTTGYWPTPAPVRRMTTHPRPSACWTERSVSASCAHVRAYRSVPPPSGSFSATQPSQPCARCTRCNRSHRERELPDGGRACGIVRRAGRRAPDAHRS
jgi:hypothetical protein